MTTNTPKEWRTQSPLFELAAGAFRAEAPPFGEARCTAQERFKISENRPNRPKRVKIGRSRTVDSLRTYPAKAERIASICLIYSRMNLNFITLPLSLAHKPVLLWAVVRRVFY